MLCCARSQVDQLNNFAVEVIRVSVEVGTEGKLGGTARVENVEGTWREITDCVNSMASNLTQQVRAIATVTEAVAAGDLERTIDVDAKGEILALKDTVNNMVRQLRTFGAEVTRVALEVGTEGKLGGRAYVEKWVLLCSGAAIDHAETCPLTYALPNTQRPRDLEGAHG